MNGKKAKAIRREMREKNKDKRVIQADNGQIINVEKFEYRRTKREIEAAKG